MATVRKTFGPGDRPKLSPELAARQEAMTEDQIQAAAEGDPDNPPLTAEEMALARPANPMRRARLATGLSQPKFAARYHINVARVRDVEQGRTEADGALAAYLRVIELETKAVDRALSAKGGRAAAKHADDGEAMMVSGYAITAPVGRYREESIHATRPPLIRKAKRS